MSRTTNVAVSQIEDPNAKHWDSTGQVEIWNGRLAVFSFVFAVLVELLSNQGIYHF